MNSANIERYESWFRQATPLFLLGLIGVVLVEPWLPIGWLRERFGHDCVLRAALVFLIGYVLLLWGESLRLHGLLTGVLQAFRQFRDEQGGAPVAGTSSGRTGDRRGVRNSAARLDAARLLVAAMGSADASIRSTSHHNLVRLVGEDLGEDPAAWQAWIDRQAP